MAGCAVCGKQLGGFMGAEAPNSEQLAICSWAGIELPAPICVKCCLPYVLLALESKKRDKEHEEKRKEKEIQERLEFVRRIEVLTVDVVPFAYDSLGFVSAHTALGTGPLTAIASKVTDMFGKQSSAYHQKIQEAESACLQRLRENAGELGADAVIGVRATYTELTGGHSQLLVCLVGTAVKKSV